MKTFAGVEKAFGQYDSSKVVLLPVPYDGTSTWGKGADKGPMAFLDAAENMELYDIETQSEPYKNGVFLAPEIKEKNTPESMTEAVYNATKKYTEEGKVFSLIGGEHSVSIGSIRALGEKYKDLTVLQLDAHTDLRPSYMGSRCNHACAVFEANQNHHLVQVGIRSMDKSELPYLKAENVFFAHKIAENPDWQKEVIERLGDNPLYITIDLDAFDPSVLPSTGTPEPGGLEWYPTLKLLKQVCKEKNVVGFDIVELAPNPNDKSSDFLAAKLYYKILAYLFEQ